MIIRFTQGSPGAKTMSVRFPGDERRRVSRYPTVVRAAALHQRAPDQGPGFARVLQAILNERTPR